MKLIIDIPEEDRKDICNIHFVREDLKFKIGKSIMNGTPFDSVIEDIKAEIDEQYDRVRPYNIDVAQGLEMALDILDRIGKAESEDKE